MIGFSYRAVVTGVFVLAALATGLAQRADAPAPIVVRVVAERFAFSPSELTVAPETTVEFHLTSDDTGHGFRILGQSVDVTIPKRGRGTATVQFTPPRPGSYVFECSRMCGAGHSFMRGTIHVKAHSSKDSR